MSGEWQTVAIGAQPEALAIDLSRSAAGGAERAERHALEPAEGAPVAIGLHADQQSLVTVDEEGGRLLRIESRIDFADGFRLFQNFGQFRLPGRKHLGEPCPESGLRAAAVWLRTPNRQPARGASARCSFPIASK
jgi:hypothetical protein